MYVDGVVFKIRRGTTAQWASSTNPLGSGEPGYDVDLDVYKIGDGSSMWAQLPEFIDRVAIQTMIANSGGAGSDSRVGDLSTLSTTNKSNLVAAINEVNVPSVPLVTLYNNAKAG